MNFAVLLLAAILYGAPAAASESTLPSWRRNSQEIKLDGPGDSIRVAFGSCYGKPGMTSRIFETVVADEPDLFIWLGDVSYVDSSAHLRAVDPDAFYAAQLARTKEAPGYSALEAKTHIVGVWDDNDYGANNAGKDYPRKEASRELWLDFIGEPADSERRLQKNTPIH